MLMAVLSPACVVLVLLRGAESNESALHEDVEGWSAYLRCVLLSLGLCPNDNAKTLLNETAIVERRNG